MDGPRTFEAAIGRGLARWLTRLERIETVLTPRVRRAVTTYGLLITFAVVSLERFLGAAAGDTFFIDLRVYRAAAAAALAGDDPWRAAVDGITYAGPPPTLLAYVPTALLPEPVAIALALAISLAAAFLVLRALRCPLWWILFPPIADSLLVLNPDIIVIAILVAAPRLAAIAPVLKVYAVVPMAAQGHWRAIAIGGLLCLISVPLWPVFLADREAIAVALDAQSFGGLSAWGTWLMVPVVVALFTVRRQGAEWLAVPALWPFTQLHYAALALPVAARSPLVAFLLSFAVAPLPAVAAILYAISVVVPTLAAPYRSPRTITRPSTSS